MIAILLLALDKSILNLLINLLLKDSQLTPPFWYVFMSANHHKRLREYHSGAETADAY